LKQSIKWACLTPDQIAQTDFGPLLDPTEKRRREEEQRNIKVPDARLLPIWGWLGDGWDKAKGILMSRYVPQIADVFEFKDQVTRNSEKWKLNSTLMEENKKELCFEVSGNGAVGIFRFDLSIKTRLPPDGIVLRIDQLDWNGKKTSLDFKGKKEPGEIRFEKVIRSTSLYKQLVFKFMPENAECKVHRALFEGLTVKL
jgi:hypothetical protein